MRLLDFLPTRLLVVLAPLNSGHAAAWLQPEDMIAVHYEYARSAHSEVFQSVKNDYTSITQQLYVEYGVNEELTMTVKHLEGSSGTGIQAEEHSFYLQEITLRQSIVADRLKLLPFGIKPLWKLFSPNSPKRYGAASFDLGVGYNTTGGNKSSYLIAHLSGAEKIETSHKNPLSMFFELSMTYQHYENKDQGLKAVSRIELGYQRLFIAYERLDGRFKGQSEFYEHFWFTEIGVPLTQNIILTAKRGQERTLPGLPQERPTVFGLRLQLDSRY